MDNNQQVSNVELAPDEILKKSNDNIEKLKTEYDGNDQQKKQIFNLWINMLFKKRD